MQRVRRRRRRRRARRKVRHRRRRHRQQGTLNEPRKGTEVTKNFLKTFCALCTFLWRVNFYASNRVIRNTTSVEGQLHQRQIRVEVVAPDQRSQAHRAALSRLDHLLLLYRGWEEHTS